jgi:hypothetical protein
MPGPRTCLGDAVAISRAERNHLVPGDKVAWISDVWLWSGADGGQIL